MAVSLRSIRLSAEALGVSVFTIRRLIAAGQIKAVNIGSRVMVSEAELERAASQGVGSTRRSKRSANTEIIHLDTVPALEDRRGPQRR